MDLPGEPDWTLLAHELGTSVSAEIEPLLAQAKDKASPLAKEFGRRVGLNLVTAMKAGHGELRAEVQDQVRALAHLLQIELQPLEWSALEKVLTLIFRVATKTLASMVPGLGGITA